MELKDFQQNESSITDFSIVWNSEYESARPGSSSWCKQADENTVPSLLNETVIFPPSIPAAGMDSQPVRNRMNDFRSAKEIGLLFSSILTNSSNLKSLKWKLQHFGH